MISVKELAREIGGEFEGDGSIEISGVGEPATAKLDQVALAADPKFLNDLKLGQAKVAIMPKGTEWKALGLEAAIFVTSARKTMVLMSYALEVPWALHWKKQPIHPTAIIDPSSEIGENVIIGPFSIIGPNSKIANGCIIHDHVTIAQEVEIGQNAQIYSGVRIGPQVKMGHGVVVMANSVIGADGFSYLTPNADAIRDARNSGASGELSNLKIERINSLGSVSIGDDVEFGAGCTIDRGTIKNTVIGSGTKIDNMVHIAHNVTIGQNCLLCAQVGIAGSANIGDRTILAGQVGVGDHVNIGSDVLAAGKSAISSHIASGQTVMGNPAIKMSQNVESYKGYRRLPRLFARVKELEARIAQKFGEKGDQDV